MATTTKKTPAAKSTKAKAAPAKQEKVKDVSSSEVSVGVTAVEAAPGKKKVLVGTVMSNKMQKTIVVKVDRRVRHPLYKKYVTRSRHFKAHDETNQAKVGDLVAVVESRPLSREKRWALQSILRRAAQTLEVNV